MVLLLVAGLVLLSTWHGVAGVAEALFNFFSHVPTAPCPIHPPQYGYLVSHPSPPLVVPHRLVARLVALLRN